MNWLPNQIKENPQIADSLQDYYVRSAPSYYG